MSAAIETWPVCLSNEMNLDYLVIFLIFWFWGHHLASSQGLLLALCLGNIYSAKDLNQRQQDARYAP